MNRAAIIACLLICANAAGCQSDETSDFALVRKSSGDPEFAAQMRHIDEMTLEMIRHSAKMAELEPPAPPEFYMAIGVYYHVHQKWPTEAAQLKQYGWEGRVPVTFAPQPHGGVDVVYGDQVKRTFTLFTPEARRTGLITRDEAASP